MKKKLLKIGTLNVPADRWQDALCEFDKIYVFCFDREKELSNKKIQYIKYPTQKVLNRFFYKLLMRTSKKSSLNFMSKFLLIILRMLNNKLLSGVRALDYDVIHSSYNDFDESAFLTLLLNIPNTYSRAQKETRLSYSYLEKECFLQAKKVILNDELNKELFEKKYGQIFKQKEVLLGSDEDVRSRELLNTIEYDTKYSTIDGKIHAVILAGRVLSTSNNTRSGGRLYYIPMIIELLEAGFVVHLHTGKVVEHEGYNPYEELAAKNSNFIIEEKLDFSNDIVNAYKVLSRYDIGILHAHIQNTEVTEFDKVNIPHRYYEYELAHVVPVEIRNGNYLLEKKARDGFALIYDNLSDISLSSLANITWDTPTFIEYIREIF